MRPDQDRDFFVLTAIEWAAARAAHPHEGQLFFATARALYREAAWCHLLFRAGRHAAVLNRLRLVGREVFGIRAPDADLGPDPDAASTLALAADLFGRMRAAVAARFPAAFAPTTRSVA
jgi:hypothetical protein